MSPWNKNLIVLCSQNMIDFKLQGFFFFFCRIQWQNRCESHSADCCGFMLIHVVSVQSHSWLYCSFASKNHALWSGCYLHWVLVSVFATAQEKHCAAMISHCSPHINPQCGLLMPFSLHMTLISLIWKPGFILILMIESHSHCVWFLTSHL